MEGMIQKWYCWTANRYKFNSPHLVLLPNKSLAFKVNNRCYSVTRKGEVLIKDYKISQTNPINCYIKGNSPCFSLKQLIIGKTYVVVRKHHLNYWDHIIDTFKYLGDGQVLRFNQNLDTDVQLATLPSKAFKNIIAFQLLTKSSFVD